MQSFEVVGYIYQANIYCSGCIDDVVIESLSEDERSRINAFVPDMDEVAREFGFDPGDESSYDSDEYPKVFFSDQCVNEERCGRCDRNLIP